MRETVVFEYVIYPKGGLLAAGVPFRFTSDQLGYIPEHPAGWTRACGDPPCSAVLHAWWRSLHDEEVARLVQSGVTLDSINKRMAVHKIYQNPS